VVCKALSINIPRRKKKKKHKKKKNKHKKRKKKIKKTEPEKTRTTQNKKHLISQLTQQRRGGKSPLQRGIWKKIEKILDRRGPLKKHLFGGEGDALDPGIFNTGTLLVETLMKKTGKNCQETLKMGLKNWKRSKS